MRNQRKRLHESQYFRLSRCRSKTGRVYYAVTLWNWRFPEPEDAVRDIVDPLRNRAGRTGTDWRYTNRKEAEQMYSMLLLKWS
jgi:hypothetical protein